MHLREVSKLQLSVNKSDNFTYEEINTGSMLRIADAVETVSRRYSDLLSEVEQQKRTTEYYRQRLQKMERRVNALRGVITRMKRRKS